MNKRIDDIEILRGFAVLFVVTHHALGNLFTWTTPGLARFGAYFSGGFGVDLFFAISTPNPPFNNAHWLKSELGTLIGDLEKQPIDAALRNQINLVKSARNNLESDISDFLENRDLNNNMQIGPSYQKGIDLYRENVAPYLANKKLREITRGRKTIVKNIHSIFDTPSDIVDKEGNIKIGPINKIMQDLPEQSKNRILFNAIGGKQKGSNQLLNNLQKAKNKGFGSYFTPDINEDINILNQRLLNKNRLLTGAKIATGAGLGLVAFEDLYHALK